MTDEKSNHHPPFENVGGFYVVDELKKIIFFTKDMLLNQLQRDCPKIATSFDDLLTDDLAKVSELLSRVYAITGRHIIGRDLTDKGRSATCARLLNTAVQTLTGCIHLARGGFRLQYAILSRSVVETICTVLHLLVSPLALQNFHLGKLKSTKSVSAATKVLPVFGQLWGTLSNQFVHITTQHSTFEPLVAYKTDDEDFDFIRSNMKALAWLLYVSTELAFIADIDNAQFWKIIESNDEHNAIAFDPSEEVWAWSVDFIGIDMPKS